MASAQQDLLHVLAREHRDHSVVFHEMIDRLQQTGPRHRRRQLNALTLNLAVHFTAERVLVHPLVVATTDHGDDTRRAREREILGIRDRMADVGAALDDPEHLRSALLEASRDTTSHADREELEVFVYVRHVATPKQLRRLGRLHATLRQRLPTRYQREGAAPNEPWGDIHLLDTLESWYDEALPSEELPTADASRDPDRQQTR